MGLIEEPFKLPFQENDNLPRTDELYEEVGSLESDKLFIERPPTRKVLAEITKRYVLQVTLLDDS